jgi:hypothetical protein
MNHEKISEAADLKLGKLSGEGIPSSHWQKLLQPYPPYEPYRLRYYVPTLRGR